MMFPSVSNRTSRILLIIAGILLIPALFVFGQDANIQSSSGNESIGKALQDLSQVTGQEVTRVEQARAICNLEEHLTECAEIGKRHNLFSAEEIKQVDTVLSELKGKIVDDLKACQDETCLIGVANQLARNLASKNSALARELDLTPAKIQEKKIIVDTAKEVGVDFGECRTMDPDTASVELLRSCAKLAKHERVQKILPAGAKELVERTDTSLALQESLRKGEYQCGDNTLEGCGNYCLNPTETARTGSTSSIPMVCRQIAEKFFGKEGVKDLENAYTQVKSANDYYQKKVQAVTFTTQDGKILTNPADIGRYMEGEMQKGNVEAIERGMDFMVTRGFVKSEDKDFATGMAKKIREQGGGEFNFDECAKNPDKCDNFVPENHREGFGIMADIHRIMTEEMRSRGVPDPSLCESNREYGEACVNGARAVLPKIQEIAKKFPQAQFIIDEIQQKISFGDKGFEARRRVEDEFRKGSGEFRIGEKAFRNFEEMEVFCKENGSTCLTETAKKGFIGKDYAKDRYEHSYEVHFGLPSGPFPSKEFPGQGPFPGFVPPGAGGDSPPGKIPGFTAPGPGFGGPSGFNKEEALKQFQAWLDNPVGAPPIPSTGYPGGPGPYPGRDPYPGGSPYQPGGHYPPGDYQGHPTPSFCPIAFAVRPCADGQYRPESRDERGCFVAGECVSITKSLPQPVICPALSTVAYCSPGTKKVVTYSSPECGEYYDCRPDDGRIEPQPSCPSGQFWNGNTCVSSGVLTFPYQFSNSKLVNSFEEGRNYCLEKAPRGDALEVECRDKFGVNYSHIIPQCSDGRDNDNDGKTDYPADSSCYGSNDDDEFYPPTPTGIPQCSDGRDNDNDGKTDYPADQSCYGPDDNDEWYPQGPTPQPCGPGQYWNGNACTDGGIAPPPYPPPGICSQELINLLGDGCHSMGNAYFDGQMTKYVYPGSNTVTFCTVSYIQNCTAGSGPQPPPGTPTQCSDGIDNDSDGQIDYPADTGCYSQYDNDETYGGPIPPPAPPPPGTPAQCSDGRDNDNDGKTDYPADPSCYGPDDNDEYYPTSITGGGTCPSFAHEMSGYCMLNNDTSRCAEYPNASTEANYNNIVCQQRSGTTPTPPPGSGCGSQTSPASCGTQQGCSWYYPPSGGAGWCQSSTYTTCPSGQYWYVPSGGGAGYCKTTSPTDCPSGQYWNGTSCISSTTPPPSPTPGGVQCSDGIDNDGDGKVDYPADPDCYDASTDTSENCCYSPPVGSCYSQTSQTTCQSAGCTWYVAHHDGTHCDDAAHGQSTSPPTSSGSCPSGYHYMSNSLTVGATTYNGYCMSDSNSSTCQPVNGGATFSCGGSTTTSPPPSSTACNSNGVCEYGESTGSCPSDCGSYTSPPPSTTTCASGQYWNGTSCVTDTHNCPSGQYWNGTVCVTSTTPPPTTPPPSTSTTCASGQYWDGAACVTSPPPSPPPTTPPPASPPPTSPPPSPPPTSYLRHCPTSHDWNGSYCVARKQSTAHLLAQVSTTFRNVSRSISGFFGW